MPISWLDVILIVIMLISGFLAMVRGFTREVLSIFSWAVAAVAALYLTPKYAGVLTPYIDNQSVAQIVFAAGVFIITLIVVSLITFRISDKVLDSRVGALDRTLGFVFGLARGFLLVAIVFILFSALARDRGYEVSERRLTRDDVYLADEAFFTGTAAEVVPIVELDRRTIGDGKPGRITSVLRDAYASAVRGGDPAHRYWLTPIGRDF